MLKFIGLEIYYGLIGTLVAILGTNPILKIFTDFEYLGAFIFSLYLCVVLRIIDIMANLFWSQLPNLNCFNCSIKYIVFIAITSLHCCWGSKVCTLILQFCNLSTVKFMYLVVLVAFLFCIFLVWGGRTLINRIRKEKGYEST